MEIAKISSKDYKRKYRETRNCKEKNKNDLYITYKNPYYAGKYIRFFNRLLGKTSEEVYKAVGDIEYKGKPISNKIKKDIIKYNIYDFDGTYIKINNYTWLEENSDVLYHKCYYFKDNILCVTKIQNKPKNPKYIKEYTNIVDITGNVVTYQKIDHYWNQPSILTLNTIEIIGLSGKFISTINTVKDIELVREGELCAIKLKDMPAIVNNKRYIINKYNYADIHYNGVRSYCFFYGDKVYKYKKLKPDVRYKDLPFISIKEVDKKFKKIDNKINNTIIC